MNGGRDVNCASCGHAAAMVRPVLAWQRRGHECSPSTNCAVCGKPPPLPPLGAIDLLDYMLTNLTAFPTTNVPAIIGTDRFPQRQCRELLRSAYPQSQPLYFAITLLLGWPSHKPLQDLWCLWHLDTYSNLFKEILLYISLNLMTCIV